jgi:murein DD-endopeptidase MepM/ murein hydrolase activator NlpD
VQALPAHARPGDAFIVVVRGAADPPVASVAGHPLVFFPVGGGYAAFGGLPVETPPGPLAIEVKAAPTTGGADRLPLSAALEIVAPHFPARDLRLPTRFVEAPPPEVRAQIDADRAALAAAFAQPASPPLFTAAFAWPSRARVTAGYGERRTLNGVKPSQHYGLDLAGRLGDPVRSANAGRVALVRDCWASGLTVVVWHGAGLYTTYLHLARALVAEGATVKKGQRIGLVGRSGRASGPHLHWGVRVGDRYVDPRSLLALPRAWR